MVTLFLLQTDRHMQRVQLVNHIREGGGENEWRMKYLNMPNLTHIVCNVCSYQSNSLQKVFPWVPVPTCIIWVK